jgi:hypothetical protein
MEIPHQNTGGGHRVQQGGDQLRRGFALQGGKRFHFQEQLFIGQAFERTRIFLHDSVLAPQFLPRENPLRCDFHMVERHRRRFEVGIDPGASSSETRAISMTRRADFQAPAKNLSSPFFCFWGATIKFMAQLTCQRGDSFRNELDGHGAASRLPEHEHGIHARGTPGRNVDRYGQRARPWPWRACRTPRPGRQRACEPSHASAGYSLNSSRYLATPEIPAMACESRTSTMKASSGMPSHWLTRPCFEAGWNPKRG